VAGWVGEAVGPLTQERLDQRLGFAVGCGRYGRVKRRRTRWRAQTVRQAREE
jgi:hypothetical protein